MASILSISSTIPLRTGHLMPRLGFGVYQCDTTKEAVLEAFKAGYRHIDTAQAYGNEAEVGEAFKEFGLQREDVFITTKVYSGEPRFATSVEDSLKRLQFDYVDLMLVHDPLNKEKRMEIYKTLLEGKAAGKVRTVGVSNYNLHHFQELEKAGLELPSVNQVELHPLCQQKPIVEYCKKNGIVVQAYCPIIRGDMGDPVIQELASKYERDPAHILLRWSLQSGYVPLPKSATPSRIHSNANLYDFELTEEEMARLNALDKGDAGAISWNPVTAE